MALQGLKRQRSQLLSEGFNMMLEAVVRHKGNDEEFVSAIAVDAGIAKVLLKQLTDDG